MFHLRRTFVIVIALAGGCSNNKSYNVANPVMGPPPPRVAMSDRPDRPEAANSDEILQASFSEETPLLATDVIARINGRPLLAGEVLEQYGAKMKEYDKQLTLAVDAKQLSEAEKGKYIRKAQQMLIKRDLDRMIEQTLMAQAVRSKLKKDQLEAINKQIETFFEKDVVSNLKKKFDVDSAAELELVLQKQGTSLETMRKVFADQQLASQYVRTKIGEEPRPNRSELIAVYNEQIEKYSRPMQVKWQQLQVSITAGRNRSEAEKIVNDALQAVRGGMSFDDAVKKYSDGPLKQNGGHWDWTQPASVANAEVRTALEQLKSGQTSKLLVSPTAVQVIKILDRREPGHLPLEEVQEEIRMQIIEKWREGRVEKVISEVHENAIVEILFTDDSASQTKTVQ